MTLPASREGGAQAIEAGREPEELHPKVSRPKQAPIPTRGEAG